MIKNNIRKLVRFGLLKVSKYATKVNTIDKTNSKFMPRLI